DHAQVVRVAVHHEQALPLLVPRQSCWVQADGDGCNDAPADELDARDGTTLGDVACVDANGFRTRIAALLRRSLAALRLRSAEDADPRRASVGRDDRGDGEDAKWNGAEQRTAVGVEHGERVVRRKWKHDD